ncbi:hypothetical protein AR158_c310R [Paramecium bursaria Chlorella virus AR158]|uniref:hypothetical protein n=1 Tax=Paramecium bursaria Chlorella virus AR158 TaxID=380598 RepID=UPI00015AA91A|nr:hypothetical protein AR158_c310R [Paramecium bursaria Chlorella virus AR158]ABU43855.1 hypothetical protein AR158_c310R [Paramecium bursaria Chlorella virus AR158]
MCRYERSDNECHLSTDIQTLISTFFSIVPCTACIDGSRRAFPCSVYIHSSCEHPVIPTITLHLCRKPVAVRPIFTGVDFCVGASPLSIDVLSHRISLYALLIPVIRIVGSSAVRASPIPLVTSFITPHHRPIRTNEALLILSTIISSPVGTSPDTSIPCSVYKFWFVSLRFHDVHHFSDGSSDSTLYFPEYVSDRKFFFLLPCQHKYDK